MKKASIILALVGGLLAISLGIKWISDYEVYKDKIVAAEKLVEKTGNKMPVEFNELKKLRIASFLLIAFGLIGASSGFLMGKLGNKVAGGVMVVSAGVPAVLAPKSLIFTFILIIGGILAFLVKPKE